MFLSWNSQTGFHTSPFICIQSYDHEHKRSFQEIDGRHQRHALVDVMLVLLIIFMVTVPMMKHGIDVNLPQTTAKAIKSEDERLIVTIKKDGKVCGRFRNRFVHASDQLEQIYRDRADKEVLLHADASLEYGYVVKVTNEIRKAGVTSSEWSPSL